MNILNNKGAVVTGAASGIGKAIATAFIDAGASVLLCDRDASALTVAVRSLGERALGRVTDVSDEGQVEGAMRAAREPFGSLDIVVNNAGFGAITPLIELPDEKWKAIHAVTLGGVFYGVKHGARHMLEQGHPGVIINISSVNGRQPGEGQSAYCAAKAGVDMLTRCGALELGARGIVVAGGGFSGVETIGAINDFLRDIARHYRRASADLPAPVLVEPFERLLPEFEPALGVYVEAKLRAAGIDVRLQTKVTGFDGRTLLLDTPDGVQAPSSLAARTLIWTAGVSPSPLVEALPLKKERGRIAVDPSMAVPGCEGVWACGDCAAIPDPAGKPYPTTAQHAIRQGRLVGANIAAAVRGQPLEIRPFRYALLGQFAAIGRQRAVGTLLGVQFSGFVAWLVWRSVYLLKLPRLDRKLRVLLQWCLDSCFAKDTVQLLTVQTARSGRMQELLDSARAAEAADGGQAVSVSLGRG